MIYRTRTSKQVLAELCNDQFELNLKQRSAKHQCVVQCCKQSSRRFRCRKNYERNARDVQLCDICYALAMLTVF